MSAAVKTLRAARRAVRAKIATTAQRELVAQDLAHHAKAAEPFKKTLNEQGHHTILRGKDCDGVPSKEKADRARAERIVAAERPKRK